MTYLIAWEFSATYLFLKKSYLLDNKFLSGGLGARPAQREVVKMKIFFFRTGLQVHLEDMFWV